MKINQFILHSHRKIIKPPYAACVLLLMMLSWSHVPVINNEGVCELQRQTAPDVGIKEKWVRRLADANHTGRADGANQRAGLREWMVIIHHALIYMQSCSSDGHGLHVRRAEWWLYWLHFILCFIKKVRRSGVVSPVLRCKWLPGVLCCSVNTSFTGPWEEEGTGLCTAALHSSVMFHTVIHLKYDTSITFHICHWRAPPPTGPLVRRSSGIWSKVTH